MRKQFVTFLILLMVALPVWSASRVCHHLQPVVPSPAVMQAKGHHCCLDHMVSSAVSTAGDECHCDQLQHSQFILDFPEKVLGVPSVSFLPAVLTFPTRPGCIGVLYRPPIL